MPAKEEKTCRGCGRTLPLDAFWKRKRYKDGYNPRCKDCLAKTAEQREVDRARSLDWYHANKERAQANNAASRRRHPERRAARQAVYNAIKRGEMERQPCEVCGDESSHAHHDDYARKLEVRWLCQAHHAEADRARRAAA